MKDVDGLLTVLRNAEAVSYHQPLLPAADVRLRAAISRRRWSIDAGWLAVFGAVAMVLLLLVQVGNTPRPRPLQNSGLEDAGALAVDLGYADVAAASATFRALEQQSGGPRRLP